MTAMVRPITGASSTLPQTWKTIKWNQASIEVKQLQMRIAKAVGSVIMLVYRIKI